MEKIFDAIIDDLDMSAHGIAHKDNKTIFVNNALIGEKILCEISKQKQNLIWAKNLEILSKSADRTKPICPYFFECGGCDLQHLKYQKQLEFKKTQIKLSFKKICDKTLQDFDVVKSQNEFYYRNKMAMKISSFGGKKTLCFYQKNSHNEVQISSCKILNQKFEIVIDLVNNFLAKCGLDAYDETTKTGTLKHIVARIIDNKLLLTFVITENKKMNNIPDLFNNLCSHFDSVGINISINKSNKEILSTNFKNLIGNNVVSFENLGIKQQISNQSFLQVNTLVANKLYEYVTNQISEDIVNAYSGAGLLSAIIAKKHPKNRVYAIEINNNATNLANNLKKENEIQNLQNFCGDAAEILNSLNLKSFNLVVDPPKSGLDDKMIETINTFLPKKIVYISCNKISLAKNFNKLKNNYEITSIKAFDMFPQTKDVETVITLEKINKS